MNRLVLEEQLWSENYKRIMGLDEVGRGCLAGPVVAAGVILDPNVNIEGIRDSKAMTLSERLNLEEEIKAKALF
ncbi:MAG: ribonuclease HII, partial [Bacteroidota bacterium]